MYKSLLHERNHTLVAIYKALTRRDKRQILAYIRRKGIYTRDDLIPHCGLTLGEYCVLSLILK